MKKPGRIILGSLLLLVAVVVSLIGLVVCCTIVLAPFGLAILAAGSGIGTVAIHLITGRSVTKKPSVAVKQENDRAWDEWETDMDDLLEP